jgi:hypothetical protein
MQSRHAGCHQELQCGWPKGGEPCRLLSGDFGFRIGGSGQWPVGGDGSWRCGRWGGSPAVRRGHRRLALPGEAPAGDLVLEMMVWAQQVHQPMRRGFPVRYRLKRNPPPRGGRPRWPRQSFLVEATRDRHATPRGAIHCGRDDQQPGLLAVSGLVRRVQLVVRSRGSATHSAPTIRSLSAETARSSAWLAGNYALAATKARDRGDADPKGDGELARPRGDSTPASENDASNHTEARTRL